MISEQQKEAQIIPFPTPENRPSSSPLPLPSPDWLRSFPGCEHYKDEEAIQIIQSIDTYVNILINVVMKNGTALDIQESTKTIDLLNPFKRAA